MEMNNFWHTSEELVNIGKEDRKKENVEDKMIEYKKINIVQSTGYIVTLLPSRGEIQTIVLTENDNGIYRFENSQVNDRYDYVYVEAYQGAWVMKCTKPAFLRSSEGEPCEAIKLDNQQIIFVENLHEQCAVYVEKMNKESLIFHNYALIKQDVLNIGSATNNDIAYPLFHVKPYHITLTYDNGEWFFHDLSNERYVYVNGKCEKNATLEVGDNIYIFGLRLIIGQGFIAINDGNGRVYVNELKLRPVLKANQLSFLNTPTSEDDEYKLFNRMPRRRKSLNVDKISVQGPPMPLNGNQIPLLLRMGSSMVMGTRSMFMGNYTMMLSSVLFPFLTSKYTDKQKKEYEERRHKKYNEYLKIKADEIQNECKRETEILNYNYPELNKVLTYTEQDEHLWERRNTDDDFLKLRLGYGNLPMMAELQHPQKDFQMEEDELENKMFEMVESSFCLEKAPVMHSFVENYICGILGTKRLVFSFVQRLIMQLIILHSYDEVKTIFLINPDDLEEMEYIKFLPHTWNDQKTFRFIATNTSEAYQISEQLEREIESDLSKPRKLEEILKERPYYMVFAMDKKIFDSMEVLKNVMQQSDNCGLSIITTFEDLPKECFNIFDMKTSGNNLLVHLKELDKEEVVFNMDRFDESLVGKSLERIFNTDLKVISQAYALPKMITFLEMFGVGRIEHLNILKRWKENNPVKSLAVPVGVGTDGGMFYLDLHEKFQGPHGLVAGMTGSGKSEFILTYILSMAVNFHPNEVAFILIDYKGGGLAGAFDDPVRGVHLPHLLGTITNLDGASIQRSLVSINSELKRRQRIFNETKSRVNEGTMDIYSYQRLYRQGLVEQPMPHLFIISDEFAELKQQKPEFMSELISIARIGRSLGVHLILATQKPSGVVNDQIRSNTKFRVCLKVQDRADSMDMLKRAEAAEIKETGRFYLQVGYNEYFALGQSAWSGAPYEPQDEVVVKQDDSIQFIDHVGQNILEVKKKQDKEESVGSQLVSLVKAISDLAEQEGLEKKSLWKPELPKRLDLDSLEIYYKNESKDMGVHAYLGMIDDPENQEQFPLMIDFQNCKNLLIVGEPESGKTTFIQSMLISLIKHYLPEEVNFYILDYSSRMLKVFDKTPHCGAVLGEEDEDKIDAFFDLIQSIIQERKKLFSELEVSSYEDANIIHKLPLILVIIDNISGLKENKKGENKYYKLQEYLKNGSNYGVKYIICSSHTNEMTLRIRQELGNRIAFHMKDKYEYGEALNCRCDYLPSEIKGRGLCNVEGTSLEMQIAIGISMLKGKSLIENLKEYINQRNEQWHNRKIAKRLPSIPQSEEYSKFVEKFSLGQVPLGYSYKDAKPVALPLKQFSMLSVYFGSSECVIPVLENFLYMAKRNSMNIYISKRENSSRFEIENKECVDIEYLKNVSMFNSDVDGFTLMWRKIFEEIMKRKEILKAYCDSNGLDVRKKDLYKETFYYMQQKTYPILIIFESIADACKNIDEGSLLTFDQIFKLSLQYNIHCIGCYYPNESKNYMGKKFFTLFESGDLIMLFGGEFQEQTLTSLPRELQGRVKLEAYNRCIMKYRNSFYPLIMPCGELKKTIYDLGEENIFG